MATVDLSKDIYSATSVFIEVLPAVVAIKNLDLDEDTKKETAINIIIESLCKRRNECADNSDTVLNSISHNYITKVRKIISTKEDIDGIIKYLNSAIKAGKNLKVV